MNKYYAHWTVIQLIYTFCETLSFFTKNKFLCSPFFPFQIKLFKENLLSNFEYLGKNIEIVQRLIYSIHKMLFQLTWNIYWLYAFNIWTIKCYNTNKIKVVIQLKIHFNRDYFLYNSFVNASSMFLLPSSLDWIDRPKYRMTIFWLEYRCNFNALVLRTFRYLPFSQCSFRMFNM